MPCCRNCGQELPDGTKFCPSCGAPAEQETPRSAPPAPAPEPQGEAPKTGRGRRIALWCVGGVILVVAVAVAMAVRAAWPGELTKEQLERIQTNAERRIGAVLETLGYEDAVEAQVVITDKVEREECDEHFLCLERNYDIGFRLTTDGSLSAMDKAAIMVWMEDSHGNVDYGTYKYKSNSNSSKDLTAVWDADYERDNPYGDHVEKIMGVTIPATDYSWTAHSGFEIDGRTCIVAIDQVYVYGAGADRYSTGEVMDYILSRI